MEHFFVRNPAEAEIVQVGTDTGEGSSWTIPMVSTSTMHLLRAKDPQVFSVEETRMTGMVRWRLSSGRCAHHVLEEGKARRWGVEAVHFEPEDGRWGWGELERVEGLHHAWDQILNTTYFNLAMPSAQRQPQPSSPLQDPHWTLAIIDLLFVLT